MSQSGFRYRPGDILIGVTTNPKSGAKTARVGSEVDSLSLGRLGEDGYFDYGLALNAADEPTLILPGADEMHQYVAYSVDLMRSLGGLITGGYIAQNDSVLRKLTEVPYTEEAGKAVAGRFGAHRLIGIRTQAWEPQLELLRRVRSVEVAETSHAWLVQQSMVLTSSEDGAGVAFGQRYTSPFVSISAAAVLKDRVHPSAFIFGEPQIGARGIFAFPELGPKDVSSTVYFIGESDTGVYPVYEILDGHVRGVPKMVLRSSTIAPGASMSIRRVQPDGIFGAVFTTAPINQFVVDGFALPGEQAKAVRQEGATQGAQYDSQVAQAKADLARAGVAFGPDTGFPPHER